ncbi:hypothetical protein KFL_001270220 [Klebsormidium nitens]|uniref:Uncharacterized protein n=1 Tax=Klebsormidium nitens TaxID=105231 RepID=A0A1Y1HW58_KLENI|nr:hypothetical protein KFL_001270220 [Klebsormidium nitens]|eukprot:GAQ82880.1 hypothetical protein KFL_001270220 [Klebsormidium nitens]
MSANEKFEKIQERLSKLQPPVLRTASQIEDKWDRLAGDFRKVFDWDKNTPSGKPSYWDMPPDMKKDNRMPPSFSKPLYLSMLWLKDRASVQPPRVFDSARPFKTVSSDGGSGNTVTGEESCPFTEAEMDGRPVEKPHDSSGIERRGNGQANKRNRSAAGLGDTLRANNEATNKTLRESEEHKNARHQETTALKKQELELETRKVALAEKNAEQAKETGAGLIGALGSLAEAVLKLANK